MRTWKRSTCPADSIYMMVCFQTAPAMRTSTRTLHLQSLVPHCRYEVVTVLRNSNLNVSMCERNRNVTALEQSWTEKIPSCGDIVHLAIEDVAPCYENLLPCLTQTTPWTRNQQHVRTTTTKSQHTLPHPPAFITQASLNCICESRCITASDNK